MTKAHQFDKDWFRRNADKIQRDSDNWNKFVKWQKSRIMERLERYNNVATVKTQLEERGDLTPYQRYKINTVSKFLLEALDLIHSGKYGICKDCGQEIPAKRLLLVPGSLRCVPCTETQNKSL